MAKSSKTTASLGIGGEVAIGQHDGDATPAQPFEGGGGPGAVAQEDDQSLSALVDDPV